MDEQLKALFLIQVGSEWDLYGTACIPIHTCLKLHASLSEVLFTSCAAVCSSSLNQTQCVPHLYVCRALIDKVSHHIYVLYG